MNENAVMKGCFAVMNYEEIKDVCIYWYGE